MPVLNTVPVTTRVTLLYGAQGGDASPITIINLDTQNTVYIGNISNVLPGQAGSFPLAPLASMSFDGSTSIYGVTLAATLTVGVVPGGNSFSPGSLTITGPVTATISGPVSVNGNVNANITNASLTVTGNVGITGTPNVTISGTPNVAITSGTVNANVTNGTINVGGSVTIVPTVAVLSSTLTNQAITAGATLTQMSLADVSSYSSYDMTMSVNDGSQGVAGHALAYTVTLNWFDDLVSGLPVFTETWCPFVGDAANAAQVTACGPMHGRYMTVALTNPSGFTITCNSITIFGSPRNQQLSDWRQSLNGNVNFGAGFHVVPNSSVVGGTDNMLADTNGFATLAANSTYVMPLNLFSGNTDWNQQFGAGIVITRSNIINIGSNAGSQTSANINAQNNILEVLGTAPGPFAGSQQMPRAACALIVVTGNPGGTMLFTMTAQQGP